MKKFAGFFILALLSIVILGSNCRPPIVEGIVVNIQHGLYDKAYDLAKQAVVEYPNDPEAWYYLGMLEGRKGNFVEMNQAFDKSLAIGPKFKTEIDQDRFKYFAENYNDGLKNYYNKARDEQDPEKRKQLFEKAADKFLNAYEADPSREEPLTPLSVSFLESGDTASAEKYLLQSIAKNPKNDTLMVSVGDFYYKTDQVEKAKDMYQKALAVNPKDVEAHLAMGEIYAKEKDWDSAIKEFDFGMQEEPNNSAIPMNIAIIYYNNEKYQDAIPYLKKTIELDPNNKDMYEILSISYLQIAQKYQDQYNETEKPEDKQKYEEIYDNELPFLLDAVQKFPDSALLWNNLGVVYAQKGNKEKAQEAFEKQKELEGNK